VTALVLLIDDSATLRGHIRKVLEQSAEFTRFVEAEDGLQGFKALVEHKPDLVVCDLVMPGFDGMKFLSLRATRPELLQVPVIMLTAETDTARKVDVLDRGAADYVTKPFNDKELLARVRVHHRVKTLQDELRSANSRLESLAVTDGLTGLFNRRHFDSLLLTEVRRTLRYKTPVAVVLIDVDKFKDVNDTYGHPMGDEVLRNLSKTLVSGIRATDYAARYGGEELALILPLTDLKGALELAERLRQQISETTHTLGETSLKKTASFGVAAFDGTGAALGPEELVKRADQALYRAKLEGRNRVVAADKQ
jgi:diguanylate cyclase (GGDEF)-like protein